MGFTRGDLRIPSPTVLLENEMLHTIKGDPIDLSAIDRIPQRFKYRDHTSPEWMYGTVYPLVDAYRWSIQTLSGGFGSFETDPWELMGQILGDVAEFHWIDNSYGWHE